MSPRLKLNIQSQPDDSTCGPTCLHALYRYYGDEMPLEQVIEETPSLEGGGTLAVFLACHALQRGYSASIYTYNLQVFDPTWFNNGRVDLRDRLAAQARAKRGSRSSISSTAYINFLDMGGQVFFEDLTPGLLRRYLHRSRPILTGLNATYLYRCARERVDERDNAAVYDDVAGAPAGHFVLLHHYARRSKLVSVVDPFAANPMNRLQHYKVRLDRIVCAVMLGIVTYDANLLIIEPPQDRKAGG